MRRLAFAVVLIACVIMAIVAGIAIRVDAVVNCQPLCEGCGARLQ